MAKIGIIMRTKDRPILLERAIESVVDQTFPDWQLSIVNDGGDPEPVKNLVAQVEQSTRSKIQIINNPKSVGMEAASNMGLNSLDSQYAMIHDDDDRLHPNFFQKTLDYLDNPPHERTKGVITKTDRIVESIKENKVKILDSYPYNDWVETVSLRRMLAENFFAPIAFVFDREACIEVGAFREDLPVLGDWDFNVRFLQKYEIGVIPETLAYYHNRRDLSKGDYASTVTGKAHLHAYYDNFLRNEWLRNDIESGRTGKGVIANNTLMLWDLAWDIKKEVKKGRIRLFQKKK